MNYKFVWEILRDYESLVSQKEHILKHVKIRSNEELIHALNNISSKEDFFGCEVLSEKEKSNPALLDLINLYYQAQSEIQKLKFMEVGECIKSQ